MKILHYEILDNRKVNLLSFSVRNEAKDGIVFNISEYTNLAK